MNQPASRATPYQFGQLLPHMHIGMISIRPRLDCRDLRSFIDHDLLFILIHADMIYEPRAKAFHLIHCL